MKAENREKVRAQIKRLGDIQMDVDIILKDEDGNETCLMDCYDRDALADTAEMLQEVIDWMVEAIE